MTYSSLEEFGQTVKKKYPIYSQMDDAKVAEKFLEVYPQYKSQIDMGGKSTKAIPSMDVTTTATEVPTATTEATGKSSMFSTLGKSLKKTILSVAPVKKTAEPTKSLPEGMLNYVSERYGDIDSAKKTITSDPVGFALDIASMLSPQVLALRGTSNVAGNMISKAKEGLKTTGSGLVKYGKEMTGQDTNQIAGEGFTQTIQGALQTATAPISGLLESIPGGKEVEILLSKPFEWTGDVFEYIADKAGVDTTTEQFQMARQQIETAASVGSIAAMPAITKGVSKGISSLSKGLKGAGETVYGATIKPGTIEAGKLQNYDANVKIAETALKEAKTTGDVAKIESATKSLEAIKATKPATIAETGVRRGISGTQKNVGLGAKIAEQEIWNKEIKPALENSTEMVTKAEFFKPLEKKISSTTEKGKLADMKDAYELIKEEYKDVNSLKLTDAQKIKSELGEFQPNKVWKGKDVSNSYNQLKIEMMKGLQKSIYDKLSDVNIRKSYLDYSKLKQLEEIGIKARGEELMPKGINVTHSLWDRTVTPITTKLGKTLYKVGDMLEFESKTPVKTLGEYLENKGITEEYFNEIMKNQKTVDTSILESEITPKSQKIIDKIEKIKGKISKGEKLQSSESKVITSLLDNIGEKELLAFGLINSNQE